MVEIEKEVWRRHPDFDFIEASNLGRIRTIDRIVRSGTGTRIVRGRILKQLRDKKGYLVVHFRTGGKPINRFVHRLVAECFLKNPGSLPEINHKDNNPLNNSVLNLEWCTREYNVAYREKYGKPAKDFVRKEPVYVVNLKTQKVLWFKSQSEASRKTGVSRRGIYYVLKGRRRQAGGYWFIYDDEYTAKAVKVKFGSEVAANIEN